MQFLKGTKTKQQMRIHGTEKHKKEDYDTCPICQMNFGIPRDLAQHCKNNHNSVKRL